MQNRSLKCEIRKGNNIIGSWITLGHPSIAEIMSKVGFDWLAIDLEHSVITIREAEELIRIIDLAGVVPLVRLTSNNADQIKRVMDAGAHGVIVPMVMSAKDAEFAVNAVKYPERGNRGFGLARAQGYGATFDEYLNWAKENTLVVVQIEHIDAVNDIDAIFAVEGVDAFFIGPNDLSGSMGIPRQVWRKEYKDAVSKIKQAGERHGVISGLHVVEPNPEELESAILDEFKFIAYSLDIRVLDVGFRKIFKKRGK